MLGFSPNDGSSHVPGPCRWPEGVWGEISLEREVKGDLISTGGKLITKLAFGLWGGG